MKLSILCVTKNEPRARSFLDELRFVALQTNAEFVPVVDGVNVRSGGFVEDVLDDAISFTTGDYVLRIDDDEKCSPAMVEWLRTRSYEISDHWSFPRAHFWGNPRTVLLEKYYWPDIQTRLSVRAKAGGRGQLHALSPFGWGYLAPVAIEHWNFLVKSYGERVALGAAYHRLRHPDRPYTPSSVEDEFPGAVTFARYENGQSPWPLLKNCWKDTLLGHLRKGVVASVA